MQKKKERQLKEFLDLQTMPSNGSKPRAHTQTSLTRCACARVCYAYALSCELLEHKNLLQLILALQAELLAYFIHQ